MKRSDLLVPPPEVAELPPVVAVWDDLARELLETGRLTQETRTLFGTYCHFKGLHEPVIVPTRQPELIALSWRVIVDLEERFGIEPAADRSQAT